jgi:presenilin-like A22 family membrane protease
VRWFDSIILRWVRELMRTARESYGVDPVAFLVIYLVSVPFFYFAIFRMVRSTVFLAATAAPFLYVLLFGRNLPWWVYAVIALLIGQGVYSLVRRLTRKTPDAP